MKNYKELQHFYKGKRVLLTGHTGFKGSYLSLLLGLMGAEVYGYALPAPTEPSLFEILFGSGSSGESRSNLTLSLGDASQGQAFGRKAVLAESLIGDIRDFEKLKNYVNRIRPDVIIHMAAQPIVRESYRIPRETYETNVMGTVNLLEAVRLYIQVPEGEAVQRLSILNVTTDKVYLNEEKPGYAYREEDKLDGYDPYSNSKSCSELVTHSYKAAFFGDAPSNRGKDYANRFFANDADSSIVVRISTARAGNVIGGGDFAKDRIIPDCMRAQMAGEAIGVRNPYSTRPYQHVLEPLFVYLTIAMEQYNDAAKQGYYNVGPDLCDCVTTGELCKLYAENTPGFVWNSQAEAGAPHEANFLRLDNGKIKEVFGWQPHWHIFDAVKASADWCRAYMESPEAANRELLRQIETYVN